MPIYEYKCASCGNVFEIIQRFSDEPLTTHDQCGGALEKLVSAAALQFKGTGWYITDYAKGNGKNGEKSKAESNSESSKSESKTESSKSESSKSESKSESSKSSESKTGSGSSSSSTSTPSNSGKSEQK